MLLLPQRRGRTALRRGLGPTGPRPRFHPRTAIALGQRALHGPGAGTLCLGFEASYTKYPRQMSGGQKQRTAIARTFIGNPQLILADEPTACLDPNRGKEITQLICKEVKSQNKSNIMVTHDHSILPYVDTIDELTHGTLTRLDA